jgi:hypothetical protein
LTAKNEMTLVAQANDGEILLYLDHSKLHAIIVFRPPCHASDSRDEIPWIAKTVRGVSNGILANLGRVLRKLPRLTKGHCRFQSNQRYDCLANCTKGFPQWQPSSDGLLQATCEWTLQ